jgi:hypothetical protein
LDLFLLALCIALGIALATVLATIAFPAHFWEVKIGEIALIGAVALVGSTIALWWETKRSSEVTERAYVNLSHVAPGVVFLAPGIGLQIQIKNAGRTPAAVTNFLLKCAVLEGQTGSCMCIP